MPMSENIHADIPGFLTGIAPYPFSEDEAVYRGHSDSAWWLDPTAARQGAEPGRSLIHDYLGVEKGRPSVELEFDALRSFARTCNESGLVCPAASQLLDEHSCRIIRERLVGDESRPAFAGPDLHDVLEAFALGQHHGLPTRLLDWTERPYVAAYFAAEGACRAMLSANEHGLAVSLAKRLSVFSTSASQLSGLRQVNTKGVGPFVRLVRTPSSGNANLRAQAGLFTLVTGAYSTALDIFVGQSITKGAVTKHSLGWKHAPALMHYLRRAHGVFAATVYPGYSGAASAGRERAMVQNLLVRLERLTSHKVD